MNISHIKYEKVEILIKNKSSNYSTSKVEFTDCDVILKESFLIIITENFDNNTSIHHITNKIYNLDDITAYKLQLKK